MDSQVPAELQEVFGEEVLGHTIVLLTCGDYLMGLKAEVLQINSNSPRAPLEHFNILLSPFSSLIIELTFHLNVKCRKMS